MKNKTCEDEESELDTYASYSCQAMVAGVLFWKTTPSSGIGGDTSYLSWCVGMER